MSRIPPGSLKLVLFGGPRSLRARIASALAGRIPGDELRPLGPSALLVHTEAEPAEVRDWLAAVCPPGGWVFVAEFEKWSARGGAVDAAWLLARGH